MTYNNVVNSTPATSVTDATPNQLILGNQWTTSTIRVDTTGIHMHKPDNIYSTTRAQFFQFCAQNPHLLRPNKRVRIINVTTILDREVVTFQILA